MVLLSVSHAGMLISVLIHTGMLISVLIHTNASTAVVMLAKLAARQPIVNTMTTCRRSAGRCKVKGVITSRSMCRQRTRWTCATFKSPGLLFLKLLYVHGWETGLGSNHRNLWCRRASVPSIINGGHTAQTAGASCGQRIKTERCTLRVRRGIFVLK
jgi:hypothetical protein